MSYRTKSKIDIQRSARFMDVPTLRRIVRLNGEGWSTWAIARAVRRSQFGVRYALANTIPNLQKKGYDFGDKGNTSRPRSKGFRK